MKQQMVDEPTGRVVGKEHKGRGYELSKGKYVEIGEEELEAVKLESSHTIDIDDFVPADEIDERYLDKPYYIVLDGKLGAFSGTITRRWVHMAKLPRSADELRTMVLMEAARQPVCLQNIDIAIRSDAQFGWRADVVSPNLIGYADCAHAIGIIVQRLRREYQLE